MNEQSSAQPSNVSAQFDARLLVAHAIAQEVKRYTATLRRRCIARAQEAQQAVFAAAAYPMLDARRLPATISANSAGELRGWARRGPSQHGEPDPHDDLDFEAYAELLAATEQSLLAELREDVAALDGPGGEEYEAFLDWAAQGDEASCARRPTRRTAAAPRCSARSASAARCSTPPTAGWCAAQRRRRLRAPAVGRGPPRARRAPSRTDGDALAARPRLSRARALPVADAVRGDGPPPHVVRDVRVERSGSVGPSVLV